MIVHFLFLVFLTAHICDAVYVIRRAVIRPWNSNINTKQYGHTKKSYDAYDMETPEAPRMIHVTPSPTSPRPTATTTDEIAAMKENFPQKYMLLQSIKGNLRQKQEEAEREFEREQDRRERRILRHKKLELMRQEKEAKKFRHALRSETTTEGHFEQDLDRILTDLQIVTGDDSSATAEEKPKDKPKDKPIMRMGLERKDQAEDDSSELNYDLDGTGGLTMNLGIGS